MVNAKKCPQKRIASIFANFSFTTARLRSGMLSFKPDAFPTSLQPVSRCKAIKTSEERRSRNPFRHSSLLLDGCAKEKVFYGFLLHSVSFLVRQCLLLEKEILKHEKLFVFIGNNHRGSRMKTGRATPTNQSIFIKINIRLNELIAKCSFSIRAENIFLLSCLKL